MIDEFLDAYCHAERKARKPHKCCECRGVIPKGETYHYHSGIFDGQGVSYKMCSDCNTLHGKIRDTVNDIYDAAPFTGLQEWIFDMGEQDMMNTFLSIKQRRGASIPDWMKNKCD